MKIRELFGFKKSDDEKVERLKNEVFRAEKDEVAGIRGKNKRITEQGKKLILEEWDDVVKNMTLSPEEVGITKVFEYVGKKFGVCETTVGRIVRAAGRLEKETPVHRKSVPKKVSSKRSSKIKKVTTTKKAAAVQVNGHAKGKDHRLHGDKEYMRLLNLRSQYSKVKVKMEELPVQIMNLEQSLQKKHGGKLPI